MREPVSFTWFRNVCHADSEGVNFRVAFMEVGFKLKQCLVWVKNQFVIGRQDYQWKHERFFTAGNQVRLTVGTANAIKPP